MTDSRDRLYAETGRSQQPFAFDAEVARVFADMIGRSVPGYELTLAMLGVIATHYAQPHTRIYDLGCSLGASTLALRHGVRRSGCQIIAVDNAGAMVQRCRENIARDDSPVPVEVRLADIRELSFEPASLVAMNFTLQFIEPGARLALLERIAAMLRPGGALVLSEKIAFDDNSEQQRQTELHHEFKRAMGYSNLEIAGKRQALDNVLVPETVAVHRERVLAAGFAEVIVWFQCFNFVSLLAIRGD